MSREKKVNIFGVEFDNMTTGQIAQALLEKTRDGSDTKKPFTVFTPNPEIVIEAQNNQALMAALKSADIISADGIGIVWASKFFGSKIKERASGYDIVQELFRLGSEGGGLSAFFLGGSEDSVTKAAIKTEGKYPGIRVRGTVNGYFNNDETPAIIDKINKSAPGLLLVGLGSPKQEIWVHENAESLAARVIIVVGGSFDVMSGNLKRAPVFFRKLGLEWLYRLIRQPRRLKRMLKLPLFVIRVLKYAKNCD